ncbi:MAG TPA: hypothetical protein VFS43_00455 [Polyangiaceae bacterium]|nr:hypothetical protein [Polyangiaceae bacterium]
MIALTNQSGRRLTFVLEHEPYCVALGPDAELEWEVYAPPARAGALRFVEMPDDLVDYRPSARHASHFLDLRLLDATFAETLAEFYAQGGPDGAEMLVSAGEYLHPEALRARPPRARRPGR